MIKLVKKVSSSEIYIKAALKRLQARIEKNFFVSISEAASFIKDAPNKIETEWDLLKEEIREEASRLDEISNQESSVQDNSFGKEEDNLDKNRIVSIRKTIAKLTKQVEGLN